MGFPKKETVALFIEMINRDGLESAILQAIRGDSTPKYYPIISFLKAACLIIEDPENNSELCMESYSLGFLSCFNLYRLQIESEDMDLDDLESQLQKLDAWVLYLEDENVKLKNENTELRALSSI